MTKAVIFRPELWELAKCRGAHKSWSLSGTEKQVGTTPSVSTKTNNLTKFRESRKGDDGSDDSERYVQVPARCQPLFPALGAHHISLLPMVLRGRRCYNHQVQDQGPEGKSVVYSRCWGSPVRTPELWLLPGILRLCLPRRL